jgi:hypothetical protein
MGQNISWWVLKGVRPQAYMRIISTHKQFIKVKQSHTQTTHHTRLIICNQSSITRTMIEQVLNDDHAMVK